MQFVYGAPHPRQVVADAIAFANELSTFDGFWQGIAELPAFTQLGDPKYTPQFIADRMRTCTNPVAVLHFTPKNPWSKTTAVTDLDRPFTILLNNRRLGRSVQSHVNTLVHEFVHNVDFFADGSDSGSFDYTHAQTWTAERDDSAPYRIGRWAEECWGLAHQGIPGDFVPLPSMSFVTEDELECDVVSIPNDEIE